MSDSRLRDPPMDENELARLREAFAADSGRPSPHDCPKPERIWESVRGSAPADETRTVLDHVAACPDCAEEWRVAVAFEEEEGGVQAVPAQSPATLHRLRSWAAAAAVAALALGVAGVWWSQRGPEGPGDHVAEFRGEEGRIESLLSEGEPLPRDEPVLRWSAGPEGSTYDILVSTADLVPVADATGLDEPRYRLPAEAVGDLPVGTELLWRVEATTPEGRRITSPTFLTRLE